MTRSHLESLKNLRRFLLKEAAGLRLRGQEYKADSRLRQHAALCALMAEKPQGCRGCAYSGKGSIARCNGCDQMTGRINRRSLKYEADAHEKLAAIS